MAKDDGIKFTGVVTKSNPGAIFLVKIAELDKEVECHLSGNVRRNKIKIVIGDRVDVEFSPYDLTKGRIFFRHSNSHQQNTSNS